MAPLLAAGVPRSTVLLDQTGCRTLRRVTQVLLLPCRPGRKRSGIIIEYGVQCTGEQLVEGIQR